MANGHREWRLRHPLHWVFALFFRDSNNTQLANSQQRWHTQGFLKREFSILTALAQLGGFSGTPFCPCLVAEAQCGSPEIRHDHIGDESEPFLVEAGRVSESDLVWLLSFEIRGTFSRPTSTTLLLARESHQGRQYSESYHNNEFCKSMKKNGGIPGAMEKEKWVAETLFCSYNHPLNSTQPKRSQRKAEEWERSLEGEWSNLLLCLGWTRCTWILFTLFYCQNPKVKFWKKCHRDKRQATHSRSCVGDHCFRFPCSSLSSSRQHYESPRRVSKSSVFLYSN
jgi:hypothetical protein